jgi:hypothetical protein
MRSIELHFMEDDGDADKAVVAGLATPSELQNASCTNCSEEVGVVGQAFYQYAIALDDTYQWIICEDCARDVLDPGPDTGAGATYSSLEEFDPLSFDED